MATRVGPGPVFVYESLIFARRPSVYAGRGLFVLAVLAGLGLSWWGAVRELPPVVYGEVLATFGRRMGRMPEAGGDLPDGWSPRLVPDLAGCQNEERRGRGIGDRSEREPS